MTIDAKTRTVGVYVMTMVIRLSQPIVTTVGHTTPSQAMLPAMQPHRTRPITTPIVVVVQPVGIPATTLLAPVGVPTAVITKRLVVVEQVVVMRIHSVVISVQLYIVATRQL